MFEEIGRGIKFPFRFDERTGGVQESEGIDRIRESLQQILGTRLGERLKRPDFGSRLKELVFEGNTEVAKALVKHHVVEAIQMWERRILISKVELEEQGHRLTGQIKCHLDSDAFIIDLQSFL